jgi:hypothetical protein
MRAELQKHWQAFKALPQGERFARVHEQQRDAPRWVKVIIIAGVVLSLGIGVLLSVLPGPAFVFYGIAAALLAIESAKVASLLDRAEVGGRRQLTRFRRWRARRKHDRS